MASATPDLRLPSQVPSRKTSPPIGWYQIIRLGGRGTCVLTTCPGLHSIAERPGFELATYWSQVQRPNHSATEPHDVRFLWEKLELWPPVKFKPLNRLSQNFVTVDYVHEWNVRSKFGKNPLTEDFWANSWNATFLLLFYLFIILRHAQRSPLTDFDAWWLKMHGITQRCAFWG